MYLARDVHVLRELADRTGLHILTNTGQYKEPFLPRKTLESTPDEIAEGWIGEATGGIDGTDIRPGCVKTAVQLPAVAAAAGAADPPAALPDAQERVTRAAAITSNATRLTIATHTGVVDAAHLVLDILAEYGVAPDRWIFVHAQNEPDPARILEVAERGAWVELDCIQDDTVEQHLQLFLGLIDAGHASQLLLSHDGGWYDVGREPYEKRPFTALSDRFLPEARRRGVSDRLLTQVTVANPARAYACRP